METRVKHLTKAQAMAAYRRACKALKQKPHGEVVQQGAGRWPTGPVLCQDYSGWYSTTRWAICWEEGPFDWAIDQDVLDATTGTAPVFVEPINGWVVGLYVA